MTNEIMVIQALADMGQAVTNMLSATKSFKGIRKCDTVAFEEKLRYLRARLRQKGLEELFRYSMMQLDSTFKQIQENKYTGEMLLIALEMLNYQHQCLRRNIEMYLNC